MPLAPFSPLWQAAFRLDLVSLILGLVVGGLLTVGLLRLWPIVNALWRQLRERLQTARSQLRTGGGERLRAELLGHLAQYHLDSDRVSLDQIFVTPHLSPPAPLGDLLTPTESIIRFTELWPELGRLIAQPPRETLAPDRLLQSARRIAITGLPGAGKSSFLAHMAQRCLLETTAEADQTPAFLHVAELDLAADSPIDALITALQNRASSFSRSRLAGFLRESLAQNRVILFVDGLDELTARQRLPYLEWLRELLKLQPTLPVVVAAPAHGFGPLVQLGFVPVMMLPWQMGQAEVLSHRWEALDKAKLPPLHAFWQASQTPFELRLRLLLVAEGAAQPARKVDLLEAALRYLLPAASAEPAWLAPVVRELWEKIAWQQLNSQSGFVDQATLTVIIEEALAEYEVTDKGSDERLRGLLASDNLFSVWANGNVGFRSPVWRDYLAASYLAQLSDLASIQGRLANLDWREVRRFYVARNGAGVLIQELLSPAQRSRRQPGLFEAAYWLAELPEDLPWQNDVLGRLGRLAIQPDTPMALRHRAIVAVAMTRRAGLKTFLEQLLGRSDPVSQLMAIACLPLLPAEVALGLIRNLLANNENEAVRQIAISALATIATPAAQTMLLKMLVEGDELTNAHVAEHLAWQGGSSWDVLREATRDEDAEVRRAANYGLVLIHEPWARELLQGLEEDSEWIVRAAANSAIELVTQRDTVGGWRPERLGDQPWLIKWAAAQGKAVPSGSAALPMLLELLQQERDLELRCAAAHTLGRYALADAAKPLHTVVKTADARLRDEAYNALCLLNRAY